MVRGQFAAFRLFVRGQAVFVQVANALIAFVADKKNEAIEPHFASPEKLQIVHTALRLVHTENLTRCAVDNQLFFDGVALALPRV